MFHNENVERDFKNTKKDIFIDEKINCSSIGGPTIIFPYIGPPGSGPGLLGSRPGSLKTEYLVALEHHANSLKNALTIAAALKNGTWKNKDLDVEVVYDSICDIESELNNKNGPNHH